jgi:molybdopterin synthase sulfur carrier subunit
MTRLRFTENIQRHVACTSQDVKGDTLRQVLDDFFAQNEQARGYVLDDQGGLRRHMVVFINGAPIRDRVALSDPVPPDAEIYVMQALSGG